MDLKRYLHSLKTRLNIDIYNNENGFLMITISNVENVDILSNNYTIIRQEISNNTISLWVCESI